MRMTNDRLRVLHVVPGALVGSSMIFVKRQIDALARIGVEADAFCLRSRTSALSLLTDAAAFRRRVRDFRPHVVHAQYGTMTSFFCAAMRARPLVITFRGSDLNPAPSMGRLRSAVGHVLSHASAAAADGIICVSGELRSRLRLRSRCEVIPTGVDAAAFAPRDRGAARTALGWDPSDPVVLFNAGRSPVGKRLDLADAAFRLARKEVAGMRLVVLDGGVDPDEVPLYMNAADCLLLTSDWEGSPTVVQEALACGLPVVSVDVGDVKERLEGVFPSEIARRDPIDIGRRLVRIVSLRTRSNGPERAMEISNQEIARRVEAFYRDVLGR